jgi:hypothetical protein
MPNAEGKVSAEELRVLALEIQSQAHHLAVKADQFSSWVLSDAPGAEVKQLRYELQRAVELKKGAEDQAEHFLAQRQRAMQDTALLSGLLREVLREVEASQRSERNEWPTREVSQELVDRIRKAV